MPDVTSPHECVVCRTHYALPDITDCPAHDGPICSLDRQCGDVCRKEPTAGPVRLPVPQLRPSSGRGAAREA
ncbi:hypothetical protein ABZ745_34910 [Streptomyces sp. NPDC013082]|uniref:hypothetical protein n=1 Tax=Streptomyces sp. NPDC013082 TaxID=3156686 RepID=UPI0033D87FEF